MQDRELYRTVLGITDPWQITKVELNQSGEAVEVFIEARGGVALPCPDCKEPSGVHDHRERRWRHLDTCEYQTVIVAQVPRVKCTKHGVKQVEVPWGEAGSRFTKAFESFAIGWLLEANVSAVARRLRLSWGQVDRIMQRAVERGLARRGGHTPTRLCIDETSFQRRHEYVTVVTDGETSRVICVADGRRKESLAPFFERFHPADPQRIEWISMDMWQPYIAVIEQCAYLSDGKICFDKFHVAKHLGDAVDRVRRGEQRELQREGDRSLVGTKHLWLRNPEGLPSERAGFFEAMKRIAIRTARAWAIKEHAMCLWNYKSRAWARKAWKMWISWAMRSRLDPVRRVARMVRDHLDGIINAIVLKATNARAESVNSKIQRVKRMACGFRNRDRFRAAIYFHLGGLDLYPEPHTKR